MARGSNRNTNPRQRSYGTAQNVVPKIGEAFPGQKDLSETEGDDLDELESDQESSQESEPETETAPIDVTTTAEASDSQPVRNLKLLLARYVAAANVEAPTKESQVKQADALVKATRFLLANQVPDVMDAFWNFHVAHKNDVCDIKTGLAGITYLDNKVDAFVVRYVYDYFRRGITRDKTPLDNNGLMSQGVNAVQLMAYLERRMGRSR